MFKGQFGVEIECCYKEKDADVFRVGCKDMNWQFSSDGSVRPAIIGNTSCELKSKIYKTTDEDIENFFLDSNKVMPWINEINSSCGFHIHVSFVKMSDYYKIFCFKFVDAFQEMIRREFKTPEELERIGNRFCRFIDKSSFPIASKGVMNGSIDRYKAINFGAYAKYKTVEFRIFPGVKDIENLKKYTMLTLNFINDYLEKNSLDTKVVNVEIEDKHNIKTFTVEI